MTLSEGDLILTGTPAGVGPLKHGDRVLATAKVQDKIVGKFSFNVTKWKSKLKTEIIIKIDHLCNSLININLG